MQNVTEQQVVDLTVDNTPKKRQTKLEKLESKKLEEEKSQRKISCSYTTYKTALENKEKKILEHSKHVCAARKILEIETNRLFVLEEELKKCKKNVSISLANFSTIKSNLKYISNEITRTKKIEEMKQSIKLYRKKQKDEEKLAKKDKQEAVVLKRVDGLPDDIKRVIQSYFTYDTQNNLLESKYNTAKTISTMVFRPAHALLKKICKSPEYFSTLSATDAEKQVYVPGITYEPDFDIKSISECRIKIQCFLQKLGSTHPGFVFNINRILAVIAMKKREIR